MNNQQTSSIWHPYSQMKTDPLPLQVRAGRGSILELEDGRELIDCISSWWVNLHGHAHPKIGEAIYRQAQKLEQVIFAGFTHEPAEELANKLLAVLPGNFSKVFFSDNGSTAVEVALKQAYQYWANLGEPDRKSFLCFQGAYHGDTLGAMSLGSRSVFNKVFEGLLFEATYAPFPCTFIGDPDVELKEKKSLEYIDRELSTQKYAAVIIEPLVQGANGMRMCRPEFLRALEALVHSHNTLLIFDEVMTGFGRTGDLFACSKANVFPDIICLAKGLTGGFLPLSVTVCTEKVYQAFYDEDKKKTLFHGHSYTANPLGCAAALASLELLMENSDQFKTMEEIHLYYLSKLSHLSNICQVRVCGTISAMDVVTEKPGYLNDLGLKLRLTFQEYGLLVRPLGQVIYFMPPYCTTKEQFKQMYEAVAIVLEELSVSHNRTQINFETGV